jgi:NAD(P)-dependent dehydrogenase (short-subunit alcohol dehydrogenase family)
VNARTVRAEMGSFTSVIRSIEVSVLACEDASYLTGQSLVVDGGLLCHM